MSTRQFNSKYPSGGDLSKVALYLVLQVIFTWCAIESVTQECLHLWAGGEKLILLPSGVDPAHRTVVDHLRLFTPRTCRNWIYRTPELSSAYSFGLWQLIL